MYMKEHLLSYLFLGGVGTTSIIAVDIISVNDYLQTSVLVLTGILGLLKLGEWIYNKVKK